MSLPTLVGVSEIAELAHVKASAVSNWIVRYDDFPAPVATLRMGPVFCLASVEEWMRRWER